MDIKPGTRCECRDHHGADENPQPYTGAKYIHGLTWAEIYPPGHEYSTLGDDLQCPRDAVRLVTVRKIGHLVNCGPNVGAIRNADRLVNVPMCAACAEHHERKGA
jgi:hypothetical protein